MSEEKQPQKQPNWLIAIIVTAVVGGIVNIISNHTDAIATTIAAGFTHINWSSIWSPIISSFSNSFIVIIIGVVLLVRPFLGFVDEVVEIVRERVTESMHIRSGQLNGEQVRQLLLWEGLEEV